MFTITKDLIGGAPGADLTGLTIRSMPLYGLERAAGIDDSIPHEGPTVKFRMWDDDGELYYEGELTDDDGCENQSAALRWGESGAGCTTIKVLRDGVWKQEIG